MKLFEHLKIHYGAKIQEHEESGRFVPLSRVRTTSDLNDVLADFSALLHLDEEPDGLAAVQYCVSELIRNVQEHSGSPEGAFVCAQRYATKPPQRVTIAVADCGSGISEHLGVSYPSARANNREAIRLAMQPGVTGARKYGMYGSPDNAGAGLFITRSIAKATGGYFVLLSGDAAFRLKRTRRQKDRRLFLDAFEDKNSNIWQTACNWQGTVVCLEIATEEIRDFRLFFQSIRRQLPVKRTAARKIRFT